MIIEIEGERKSHLHLRFLLGVRKKYKEQRREQYVSVDREKSNSRERELQQKKETSALSMYRTNKAPLILRN